MKLKIKKPIPFDFVLERLEAVHPYTRAMFGSTAVYVEDKIVLILRQKDTYANDNGVWICTQAEHHESLRKLFPTMHSIYMFDAGETNWQVIAENQDGFEEYVERACELILKADPRIGRIPKRRKPKKKPLKKKEAPRSRRSMAKPRRR